MSLSEFHPFDPGEVAKVPDCPGVYLLFQIQIPLYVDGGDNLRKALTQGKAQFPAATHFSIETVPAARVCERVQEVMTELKLVRGATFVGHAEDPPSTYK
jgi:hypothetical protein